MNLGSWIVLAVVIAIVALAVASIVKDKRAGKSISCGDCSCSAGCDGKSCPSTKLAMEMAKNMESRFSGKDSR